MIEEKIPESIKSQFLNPLAFLSAWHCTQVDRLQCGCSTCYTIVPVEGWHIKKMVIFKYDIIVVTFLLVKT